MMRHCRGMPHKPSCSEA